jgi:DHA2 family multidrug resistance protein
MAILTVTFPAGRERAQALGIWSASFAAAAVFGPLIGGPLIDNFNWRSVFLINLPVGVLGLIMASVFIKESTSEKKTIKFDWTGAITLGISLASLVLVLDKGLDWGWLSLESFFAYISTIVFAVIFYFVEVNHSEPIVDFKFFKNKIFVDALVNNFIVFMGMMGSVFLIPVFAQTFLGYDATKTGYLFIPMAAALMIAAPIGGRLTGKVQPKYVIAASTLVAGIGIYFFSYLDPTSSVLTIIIPLAIMAFGMGFGMAQRTNIIASAVPEHEVGIASSILALARNIAGAFGISVFATILNNATKTNLLRIAQNSTVKITSPSIAQQAVGLMILKAQIDAYATVFIVAAGVLVVGSLMALRIRTVTENKDVEVFVE